MEYKIHNISVFLFMLITLCFAILPHSAQAQVLTQNVPLSFGTIVLVDNNAPRSIQLLPGGGFVADPQYEFISNPQLGNYTVTGYGPGVPLTVTVSTTTLSPPAGLENFSTVATFTDPAAVVTDGAGNATFDVGATLLSNGSGNTHPDNTYTGTYSVTVTP